MTWSNMDRKLKIYLAGKMSGLSLKTMSDWRREIKNKIFINSTLSDYKTTVINPVDFYNFEEVKHQSEEEVMNFDLSHVVSSDIVIVNLDGLNTSIGTQIEIYEASYHHKIPVFAFGDKELYDNLHPWTKISITRVEDNMEDLIDYIKEFYMF